MQKRAYENIYQNEDSHFIFVGTHNTVLNLLRKYLGNFTSGFDKQYKILDAGCGTGMLLKKLMSFGRVWGVDLNPEAIKFSKKRGLANISRSSIEKLPFKENFFDAVVSIDVLYHQDVKTDSASIKEFYRVLKPGGLLIVKVPAYNWLRGKHDVVVRTGHRYTRRELRDKIKNAGFKVSLASYANTAIFPVAAFKRLLENYLPSRASSDVAAVPGFLNKIIIRIMSLEDIFMERVGLPFGLSVYVVAKKL